MGERGASRAVVRASTIDASRALPVVCAVAIALVAWPVWTLQPVVTWDFDWVAALSYAAEHRLRFGDQIAFTYGPLGFLSAMSGPTLLYDDILALQWTFVAAIQLLLAGALLVALRRSLPLVLAAVAAALVLVLTIDRTLALGFVLCALALTRAPDEPRDLVAAATPPVLGVLTGVLLLGKLNQGLELLAMALVAAVLAWQRRDAAVFGATALATAIVGWVGSGQSLGDVWPYVHHSAEVIAGYAGAMGLEDRSFRWTYAAAFALTAAALALAWDAGRTWERRRRWGLLALVAVYAGFGFKEGFVRQDDVHLALYFGDLIVLFAIVPVQRWRRALVVAGLVATVVAFGVVVGRSELGRTVNPYANVRAVADQVRTLASSQRRAAMKQDLRGRVAERYALPPQVVEAVGPRSVMLWPLLLTEIAYAYDLHLRPLPTLEPYATYTPALDRLGARMMASARAPERIIRLAPSTDTTIDDRQPAFEAPLVALAILCRYREVAIQAPWQVLARADDRCGPARTLEHVSAEWSEAVPVPSPRRPDALVLVRVGGTEPHGLERLRELLLRPHERWVRLDAERYRLVPATAADGLLLRAPPAADYPIPFALAPDPDTIAIGRSGGDPGGQLEYTFVEVPIRRT